MNYLRVLLVITAGAGAACAPTNLSYQPRMSDAELAAHQRRVQRVEDRAFYEEDRELMSEARATEMATRNAPTHVTENRNTFLFW